MDIDELKTAAAEIASGLARLNAQIATEPEPVPDPDPVPDPEPEPEPEPVDPQPASSLTEWLAQFPAGVHTLTQILPHAQWTRGDGTLAAWCGVAIHEGKVYYTTGGHNDGKDACIHVVDIITGETTCTLPDQHTRRVDSPDGSYYVMFPEQDDFMARHTGGQIIVQNGRLLIGGYSMQTMTDSGGVQYYAGDLGIAEVSSFPLDQIQDGQPRPIATPHPNIGGGHGFFAHLPNSNIFNGRKDDWQILDQDLNVVASGNENIGWNGCYHADRNSIIGIVYSDTVIEARLKPDYSGVESTRSIPNTKSKPWGYFTDTTRWSPSEVLLFTGQATNWVINLETDAITEVPNDVVLDTSNRSTNRFVELAPGYYFYYPADPNAHPVLYVREGASGQPGE